MRDMVLDFGVFKRALRELVDEYDHTFLVEEGTLKPSTVEALEVTRTPCGAQKTTSGGRGGSRTCRSPAACRAPRSTCTRRRSTARRTDRKG